MCTIKCILSPTLSLNTPLIRGQGGGVPWGQIVENEFDYLVDRGGHGGHLAEKFLKKYCS